MIQSKYENLKAFQKSRQLIVLTYTLARGLPQSEKWNLCSQMKRSSVSVLSNLVEGLSRNSNKDKRHFINMSYASLIELDTQLIICHDLNYLKPETTQDLRERIIELIKILSGLRAYFTS